MVSLLLALTREDIEETSIATIFIRISEDIKYVEYAKNLC